MRWRCLVGDWSFGFGGLEGGVRGLSPGLCLCGVRERGGELWRISKEAGLWLVGKDSQLKVPKVFLIEAIFEWASWRGLWACNPFDGLLW